MFQKTAIALATIAAAASVQAAEFNIGKETKFEVNVDVGAYYESIKNDAGKNATQFTGKGLNQVEIKGSYAVDSATKVFGEVEIDFDPIKDNDTVKTDDTKFGVDSKSFGKLTIGQFDSYFEDNVAEALGAGHGENAFVTEASTGHDGRHVQYVKKFGNATFAYDLTFGTSSSDSTKSSTGSALTLAYKMGDVSFAIGTDKPSKFDTTGAAVTADGTTGFTATYNISKELALTGLYAKAKKTDGSDTKYTGVKLAYEMGPVDFKLATQRVKPSGTSKSETETTFGVGYEVYKNMTIYLDMGKFGADKGEGDVTEIGMTYSF